MRNKFLKGRLSYDTHRHKIVVMNFPSASFPLKQKHKRGEWMGMNIEANEEDKHHEISIFIFMSETCRNFVIINSGSLRYSNSKRIAFYCLKRFFVGEVLEWFASHHEQLISTRMIILAARSSSKEKKKKKAKEGRKEILSRTIHSVHRKIVVLFHFMRLKCFKMTMLMTKKPKGRGTTKWYERLYL